MHFSCYLLKFGVKKSNENVIRFVLDKITIKLCFLILSEADMFCVLGFVNLIYFGAFLAF
jgi:hypothetical protein